MKKVSVIIPNYEGIELLPDCLNYLKKQTFKDYEVIVVDNNSEDGSVEWINQNHPTMTTIILKRNYGFAKTINDGVGIQINEVGQARSIGWEEIDSGQYEKEEYIFGATGGASLFRRDEFLKIGLFDENYFMYSEEVDFAFRAQFAGFKSIYCPQSIVYHKHKASAKKFPQHIEYWQFKNMYQTIIKDYPTSLLLKRWRWLKIILVYFNTILYQIKNGFYWPPIMTTIWLIIHLPNLLYQRNKIQKNKKVSDDYIDSFLIEKRINHRRIGG